LSQSMPSALIKATPLYINIGLPAVRDLHNGIERKTPRDMRLSCRAVLKWFKNGMRRLVL
ncbi:MAG: hypothetical protein ACXW5W_18300, partial [Candidatus Binatia bacterium]